jgi:hypothetical protein
MNKEMFRLKVRFDLRTNVMAGGEHCAEVSILMREITSFPYLIGKIPGLASTCKSPTAGIEVQLARRETYKRVCFVQQSQTLNCHNGQQQSIILYQDRPPLSSGSNDAACHYSP